MIVYVTNNKEPWTLIKALTSTPWLVVAPNKALSICDVEETITELTLCPEVTTVEPPEVAATTAESLEVSVVSTHQLSSCPVRAMEAVYDHSACPVMAKEAVCEPLVCPVTAMEAVNDLSACPVMTMEAARDLLPCPELATEATYELLSCSEPAEKAISDLSSCSEPAMEAACELSDRLVTTN